MARRLPRRLYGQREQVESAISRNKCLFGSALLARGEETQAEERLVRVLSHNLMTLRLPPHKILNGAISL
jgi:hypothetical protein